jgi:hypothetical protein
VLATFTEVVSDALQLLLVADPPVDALEHQERCLVQGGVGTCSTEEAVWVVYTVLHHCQQAGAGQARQTYWGIMCCCHSERTTFQQITAKGVWLSESKERRVKVHLWVVGLSAANIGNQSGCNGSGPSCGNVG